MRFVGVILFEEDDDGALVGIEFGVVFGVAFFGVSATFFSSTSDSTALSTGCASEVQACSTSKYIWNVLNCLDAFGDIVCLLLGGGARQTPPRRVGECVPKLSNVLQAAHCRTVPYSAVQCNTMMPDKCRTHGLLVGSLRAAFGVVLSGARCLATITNHTMDAVSQRHVGVHCPARWAHHHCRNNVHPMQ